MRPDETDDRLPPTQRRGRNAWDAIAEIARVVSRSVAGLGRLAVTPGGLFLIVVILVVAGVLNPDTLERLAQVIGDLWERIKP